MLPFRRALPVLAPPPPVTTKRLSSAYAKSQGGPMQSFRVSPSPLPPPSQNFVAETNDTRFRVSGFRSPVCVFVPVPPADVECQTDWTELTFGSTLLTNRSSGNCSVSLHLELFRTVPTLRFLIFFEEGAEGTSVLLHTSRTSHAEGILIHTTQRPSRLEVPN